MVMQGLTKCAIAEKLKRAKSTIGNELRRNSTKQDGKADSYKPQKAHALSKERLLVKNCAPRITEQAWRIVDEKLKLLWSPEQISGWLKSQNMPTVSHESIYKHIYDDKSKNGTLYQGLRCQKTRKKRYGSGKEKRGVIANRISIEARPPIVASRERYGDWEADLVIGAGQSQALVTINERKSRYTLIGHVQNKTAQAVSDTIITLLRPFSVCVHTLTTDNGKEFAQHERIADSLGADFFFAHPYSSWERGANENMNGLIRQFFSKKRCFNTITPGEIEFAVNSLNHRPRKCLGYLTPHEVFFGQQIPP